MNLENTQVQMRKGILEYCILNIISRGEVYASDMLEELTAAKMIVVEGTLYPLLARMEKLGWLKRDPKLRNHRSKDAQPYRATAAGRRALREVEDRLRELIGEVYEKKQ